MAIRPGEWTANISYGKLSIGSKLVIVLWELLEFNRMPKFEKWIHAGLDWPGTGNCVLHTDRRHHCKLIEFNSELKHVNHHSQKSYINGKKKKKNSFVDTNFLFSFFLFLVRRIALSRFLISYQIIEYMC